LDTKKKSYFFVGGNLKWAKPKQNVHNFFSKDGTLYIGRETQIPFKEKTFKEGKNETEAPFNYLGTNFF
jgi:hypothetical protein